ncbi:MAG: hypothetical protein IR158_17225 [Cellulomonas sp.]|jgi:hypothetical protein|uniref:hypothetical protein n=1 Tax=Cellulomonas sp. TaxID=40001 RepID=UPI0019DDA149|nr:hypothetical protein [Cellulomonas sp.]MBF0689494.1 hypothetical protein [Cellulomonas sp.]
MSSSRSARLVSVALALALAGGCSSDPLPEGWVAASEESMRFAVPDTWVDTGELNERWTRSWQDVEGDDARIQLAAAPEVGFYDAAMARSALMATAQIGEMPGFAVVRYVDEDELGRSERELTRTEFTYEPEDGTVYDGVLWTASADRQHHAVALQLTGPDLDPDLVAGIEETLAVVVD